MDRVITYAGSIPLETDLLYTNRRTLTALASLAATVFGSSTLVDGLACTPGSGLTVSVAAGSIYQLGARDSTAYSSLSSDATQIMQQGIIELATVLSCPAPATAGQSINYLVEAQFQQVDGTPVVLPYYNSANPTVAWTGPSGLGTAQNTVRAGTVALQVKAGTAATTGTQTTPATDAGWTALYVVTVANGQASITSSNIATVQGAPFLGVRLPQCGLNYNYVFSANAQPSVIPQTGPFNLFNTASGGTIALTLTASSMTAQQSILSVVNANGATTQVQSPAGVAVNVPQTTNGSGQTYVTLQSNGVPQGVWSGSTTYGKKTAVMGNSTVGKPVSLSSSLVLLWNGNGYVQAYNPVAQTLGTSVQAVSLSNINGAIAIDATHALIWNQAGNSQVVTITTGTLACTLGSVQSPGATFNSANVTTSVATITAGSVYLLSAANTGGVPTAVVLTVNAGAATVAYGTVATGPADSNLFIAAPKMAMGSASTGLYLYQNSGGGTPTGYLTVAFTVSGTTVTWGASAVLITGSATATTATGLGTVTPLAANSYLLQYFSGTVTQTFVVASVTGTTPSYGTAQTTANTGNSSSAVTRVQQYGSGVFVASGQKGYPLTVSGSTITIGTVLDSTGTGCAIAQALDGTWFVSTTGGSLGSITQAFTTNGSTFTLTGTALAAYLQDLFYSGSNVLLPFTSSLILNYYLIAGVWYSYTPNLNGAIGANTAYALSTNGATVYVSTSPFVLTNYA